MKKKCISRGEALVPTTQSKLSRVSSGFGLSKLTGSRRNRKESGLHKHSLSTQVHRLVLLMILELCISRFSYSVLYNTLNTFKHMIWSTLSIFAFGQITLVIGSSPILLWYSCTMNVVYLIHVMNEYKMRFRYWYMIRL